MVLFNIREINREEVCNDEWSVSIRGRFNW